MNHHTFHQLIIHLNVKPLKVIFENETLLPSPGCGEPSEKLFDYLVRHPNQPHRYKDLELGLFPSYAVTRGGGTDSVSKALETLRDAFWPLRTKDRNIRRSTHSFTTSSGEQLLRLFNPKRGVVQLDIDLSDASIDVDIYRDHLVEGQPRPQNDANQAPEIDQLIGPFSMGVVNRLVSTPERKAWLIGIYQREVTFMLSRTDALSPRGLLGVQNKAETHPSFIRLVGNRQILHPRPSESAVSSRFGMSTDRLLDRRLNCAFSPAHPSTIAIFNYLGRVKHFDIGLSFRFPHSVEIVKYALTDSFPQPIDCFTLTLATAGYFFKNDQHRNFVPFMFMPSMSTGVVLPQHEGPQVVNPLESGLYLFMKDTPSSEAFLFDDLAQNADLSKVGSEDMEPDDVTRTLAAGHPEARAIIGFPHYQLQRFYNRCSIINDPYSEPSQREIILFARKELVENQPFAADFSNAIHDAWLALLENDLLRHALVEQIIADPEYLKILSRCSGMHHLLQD